MLSDTAIIAIVATTAGVVGPLIMAYASARIARRRQAEEWAHSKDLLDATHENTAAIVETKAAVIETNAQLVSVAEVAQQTHALVNSDMTEARKNELDQAKATLVVLRKVVALDAFAGRQSDPEDVEAIHITLARIDELKKIVAERIAAQKAIDDKAAADLVAVEIANGAS